MLDEFGADNFDIVYPPTLDPRRAAGRAWSTRMPKRTAPRDVAKAYLDYLYSPEGQTIAAKNHYRPINPDR